MIMYQFFLLNQPQVSKFEKFTYPTYRSLFKTLATNQNLVAIGVSLGSDEPIGLGLAYIDENQAEILSLFIHPEYRNQGLGKTLLNRLEDELIQRKCLQIRVIYVANTTTPAFENILRQLNWNTPHLRMLVCEGDHESIKKVINSLSPKKGLLLPDGYDIFPWNELTKKDKEYILEGQDTYLGYPDLLSPFEDEDILEPMNSLGLRYEDNVIGWMITHRVAVDTIRYTKLFVKKELQGLGYAIPLLVMALQIQLKNSQTTKAVFTVLSDNYQMTKLTHKRIAPHLISSRYSWGTFKLLNS